MIKVFIVDDHAIIRRGLVDILNREPEISVIGEAEDCSSALNFLRNNTPDVAVVDISLPSQSGLDLLRQIKEHNLGVKVLILSIYSEEQYAVRTIKGGAYGYLTKDSAPDELVRAIKKISGGGKYISPALAEQLAGSLSMDLPPVPHGSLSDREMMVLLEIGRGKALVDIAEKLSLSPKTITTYRSRILDKMGLKNNADLVRYVIENKLIE